MSDENGNEINVVQDVNTSTSSRNMDVLENEDKFSSLIQSFDKMKDKISSYRTQLTSMRMTAVKELFELSVLFNPTFRQRMASTSSSISVHSSTINHKKQLFDYIDSRKIGETMPDEFADDPKNSNGYEETQKIDQKKKGSPKVKKNVTFREPCSTTKEFNAENDYLEPNCSSEENKSCEIALSSKEDEPIGLTQREDNEIELDSYEIGGINAHRGESSTPTKAISPIGVENSHKVMAEPSSGEAALTDSNITTSETTYENSHINSQPINNYIQSNSLYDPEVLNMNLANEARSDTTNTSSIGDTEIIDDGDRYIPVEKITSTANVNEVSLNINPETADMVAVSGNAYQSEVIGMDFVVDGCETVDSKNSTAPNVEVEKQLHTNTIDEQMVENCATEEQMDITDQMAINVTPSIPVAVVEGTCSETVNLQNSNIEPSARIGIVTTDQDEAIIMAKRNTYDVVHSGVNVGEMNLCMTDGVFHGTVTEKHTDESSSLGDTSLSHSIVDSNQMETARIKSPLVVAEDANMTFDPRMASVEDILTADKFSENTNE